MTTVYNTRTSLAAYVDALYAPYLKAVSRILSDSNGYLQQLASQAQAAVASASQSASSAEQSAQTASTAASNALSDYNKTNVLFVSFGKTWYGDLPSDPTDNPNTGGPLNIGARYWNTTDNKIRIYTSTGWQDYDAEAEQLQQEASISASQAAKSASEAEASSNAATTAANSIQADIIQIQKDLNELESLFTLPLPSNEIPQVNSTGSGFNFVKSGLLGVTAWNQTIANNGGYPQYAVVCDPTLPGMLYESRISSNTQQPSITASDWSFFSSTPFVSVTSFGVIDDPDGNNIESNTQNYQTAIQQCAGKYCLVHPLGLTVIVNGLSVTQSNIQWRLEGTIILNNNQNADVISITGNVENFYLFGNGTVNGSLLTNQETNGAGPAMGACVCVNAVFTDVGSSQPITRNITIEGLTLKNAQYAFYGNNCVYSAVRKCIGTQTVFGIIFSNGNGNIIENNICSWNGVLGAGLNNTIYNSSIKMNRIHDNWNQAINIWADGTQQLPQFCTIADNFIRDNFTNGVNINTGPSNQPATDLRIMNNIFQNNGRGGVGNDVTANNVVELLICGNLFDRFCNEYQGKLSDSPNSVWINDTCQQIDVHSNTFKDVGSSINYGIQLWLNSPQRGTVHSNTFMDTMAITQGWYGGQIETDSQINYNIELGGLQSSNSTNPSALPIFTWPEGNGYTYVKASSSNNNQGQCVWSPSFPTGLSWQEIIGNSVTIQSGNTSSLQELLGNYSSYSIDAPIFTIKGIIVNQTNIPLDSTSSAVSLADFSTVQYVSSQSGSGWKIVTSSGELIYSFGANSGDFSPGVCPPQEVYITWEIVANNTVDGSTKVTEESITVYGGNYWNTEINTQVPTFLYVSTSSNGVEA